MKTRVRVRFEACAQEVIIEVDRNEGEDPCDLTAKEEAQADNERSSFGDWYISEVTEV